MCLEINAETLPVFISAWEAGDLDDLDEKALTAFLITLTKSLKAGPNARVVCARNGEPR